MSPDDNKDEPRTPSTDSARTTPLGSGERGKDSLTPVASAPTPFPGSLGERYDLLLELGRGGMGVVYKARDRETGDVVALKLLQAEIAGRPELIERFKSELLLARKITHKNVCRVYDLSRFGAVAAISMEYVDGESLRSLLARVDGLSVHHGLTILRQVMAGLAEAHAQGVVHRDLKPENILIARDGTVKVMDFGIARSLDPEVTQTRTGAVIGTPAYMSPEQAEGKPADARSDLYSLGLMMYEMFTGRPAFLADTSAALVHKHLHETPPPPRQFEPHLPGFLERAILKSLEKQPKKRFQSVAELESALAGEVEARALAGDAGEVPLPPHLTRWQRSDWLLLPLAAAGLLLFFAFFERTSLAPRSKVSFDRAVLPRIAQEYAQRAGAPLGNDYEISAQPFPDLYDYVATQAGASAALELANNPGIYCQWWVEWHTPPGQGPTQVSVDNRGGLITFIRDFPPGSGSEKVTVEEQQALAEKALADFFHRDASQLQLETVATGTRWRGHPSTAFLWTAPNGPYGLQQRYTVRLVGRELAYLDGSYYPPAAYSWELPNAQSLVMPVFWLALFLLGLFQRRKIELTARWRMVTVVSFALVWGWEVWRLITRLRLDNPWSAPVKGFPLFIGLAGALAWFFESVALERSVRRADPAKFAGFVRLFDRRVLSGPCGLAILRGTFLGLIVLGVDTFLISTGTNHLRMRLDSGPQLLWQAWPFLGSPGTSAHLVLDALWQTFAIGVVTAFLASFVAGFLRRTWVAALVAAALVAIIIPGPFASLGAVQPYHWKLALLFLESLLLVWAFTRFDLLTMLAAIFTFAFWWQNYRLLVMFEPTGAAEQRLAFAVWGLVVLGAAAVAFQSSISAARQRLAAAFE